MEQQGGYSARSSAHTMSWEAKWWERQVAQKLWPQGSRDTQARSVPRQIRHCRSSSVLASAVL